MASPSAVTDDPSADEEELQFPSPKPQPENQSQEPQQPEAPQAEAPQPLGRQPTIPQVPDTDFQDNPEARHQEAVAGLSGKIQKQFDQAMPFAPSGWAPKPTQEQEQGAIRQSDIETQSQQAEAQRQTIADRRARMQQVKEQNFKARQQAEATGQRMIEDPNGQLQPLTDP